MYCHSVWRGRLPLPILDTFLSSSLVVLVDVLIFPFIVPLHSSTTCKKWYLLLLLKSV